MSVRPFVIGDLRAKPNTQKAHQREHRCQRCTLLGRKRSCRQSSLPLCLHFQQCREEKTLCLVMRKAIGKEIRMLKSPIDGDWIGWSTKTETFRSDSIYIYKTAGIWTWLFYDLRRDFEVLNRGQILIERYVDGLEHMTKVYSITKNAALPGM